MDNDAGLVTDMAHYECDVCKITATIVRTPAGELAWLDHMAIHAQQRAYRVWTWRVVQLPLE